MWSGFKCVTFLQSESSKILLRTEQMGHGHSWSSPYSAGMQSWLRNPCLNRAINNTPARPAGWVSVSCTILSFIHEMTRTGSSYFSPSELQDSCRVQMERLDNWIGILWSELLTYGKGLDLIWAKKTMTGFKPLPAVCQNHISINILVKISHSTRCLLNALLLSRISGAVGFKWTVAPICEIQMDYLEFPWDLKEKSEYDNRFG